MVMMIMMVVMMMVAVMRIIKRVFVFPAWASGFVSGVFWASTTDGHHIHLLFLRISLYLSFSLYDLFFSLCINFFIFSFPGKQFGVGPIDPGKKLEL
ncbi:LOW QUALITY PROTEIN: hypothetical protein PanWU01x14_057000 [Parasponia andersonii]|uniref:Transmembrane protein n=1 Tax=Parasponia andersonii TaxID=3476 RepID=A0A2P5DJQ9_PARAD|nr:LOW QUALITY PROTEIN: hypothetical protein PanWU01x14_057000 [Parasponia andersonii]